MRDTFIHYFQAEFQRHITKNHQVIVPERPKMLVEEIVDSDGTKRPGKTRWLPLHVQYFWPEEIPDEAADLFKVLAFVYELGADTFKVSENPEELMAKIAPNLGKGTLQRYHKQSGTMIEQWTMTGLWPHTVDFGELCYSSRADVEINVMWRFFDAKYIPTKSEKKDLT